MKTFVVPFRSVRQFLVGALNEDAPPTVMFPAFLHLKASVRIAPHPIYLLPRQGKDIKLFPIERIVDGHDVRSVIVDTGKMPDILVRNDLPAFALCHFSNAQFMILLALKRGYGTARASAFGRRCNGFRCFFPAHVFESCLEKLLRICNRRIGILG